MKIVQRVLVVEDDAVSRAFFVAALETLDVGVDAVSDAAQARQLIATYDGTHRVWLIDAHLPDGTGAGLLEQLRMLAPDVPAIAHTAETSPALHARLRAGGFASVLLKPLPVKALVVAVRPYLDTLEHSTPLVWDAAAAQRALGGASAQVDALRSLFVQDLPALAAQVGTAARAQDLAALGDALHRLQASCGFVGAARLALAVRGLRASCSEAALHEFDIAVRATLQPTSVS